MKINFDVLQMCSGHYLCDNYPDNWFELTEGEQNDFVSESLSEYFDYADPQFMIEQIENAAWATQKLFNARLK